LDAKRDLKYKKGPHEWGRRLHSEKGATWFSLKFAGINFCDRNT